MKNLKLLFYCLFIYSCTIRKLDSHYELLGNGYFYINSSSRGMIYKGDIENTRTYDLKILGHVEKYKFDDKFISAFRHITPLEFRDSSHNLLFRKQYNGDTLQYWIIDKIKDSVYGPLKHKEYYSFFKQLNMSSKTRL